MNRTGRESQLAVGRPVGYAQASAAEELNRGLRDGRKGGEARVQTTRGHAASSQADEG